MVSTSVYAEAMEWTFERFGPLNVPRVWIPEKHFVRAVLNGESISFTRKTDEGYFGLGIGSEPAILSDWNEFALPQSLSEELTAEFTTHHRWETHSIAVSEKSYSLEILDEDDDGEIAAIASITQWESGEYMLSSVATHAEMRGRGFAQSVCAGVLGLSYDRGIERVNLVVLSSNTAAISAYRKLGFQEIGKFVSYSR